jgi:hypothetical protein
MSDAVLEFTAEIRAARALSNHQLAERLARLGGDIDRLAGPQAAAFLEEALRRLESPVAYEWHSDA